MEDAGRMAGGIPDFSLDLDLIDEFLSEDAWFGVPNSTNLSQQVSAYSPALFDSFTLGANSEETENVLEKALDEEIRGFGHDLFEGRNSLEAGLSNTLKERIVRVIGWIKESHRDGDVLVQLWVPTKRERQQVLTTYEQPFSLNPNCQRLMNYRTISTNYNFPAEDKTDDILGLPGRVFVGKLPEWSPDVRYFSSKEYARVDYAQHYDIRGTLALPIFERGSRFCIAVLEVVMTTEKISYRSDIENICNALQVKFVSQTELICDEFVYRINLLFRENCYLVNVFCRPLILEALKFLGFLPSRYVISSFTGKTSRFYQIPNFFLCVTDEI